MSGITFDDLSHANKDRCQEWHKGVKWTTADWACALAGEAGEVCDAVKKLRRIETGVVKLSINPTIDRDIALAAIARELADIVISASLLANHLGLDLGMWTVKKFNEVSQRHNLKTVMHYGNPKV